MKYLVTGTEGPEFFSTDEAIEILETLYFPHSMNSKSLRGKELL
jgi:hypothetical protein